MQIHTETIDGFPWVSMHVKEEPTINFLFFFPSKLDTLACNKCLKNTPAAVAQCYVLNNVLILLSRSTSERLHYFIYLLSVKIWVRERQRVCTCILSQSLRDFHVGWWCADTAALPAFSPLPGYRCCCHEDTTHAAAATHTKPGTHKYTRCTLAPDSYQSTQISTDNMCINNRLDMTWGPYNRKVLQLVHSTSDNEILIQSVC